MKYIYLILCILGVALPYSQLMSIYNDYGLNFAEFISQPFATSIISFYSFDLMITGITAIVFIIYEGRRKQIKHLWLPIISVFAVGISLALPLFLLLRQLKLDKDK